MSATYSKYDIQARSIKIGDITSDEQNRTILRHLINNNDEAVTKLFICPEVHRQGGDWSYCPASAEELGWLGYILGKNTNVEDLVLYDQTLVDCNGFRPFWNEISRNRSIERLEVSGIHITDHFIRGIGKFLKNNTHLKNFSLETINFDQPCQFGNGALRQLALALGGCSKSFRHIKLELEESNNQPLAELFVAMSMHQDLEKLVVKGATINETDCVALSTLLQWSTNQLKFLNLDGANIGDMGMEILSPALTNMHPLRTLNLSENSIGDRGLEHLLPALTNINVKNLHLNSNPSISAKGWEKLAKQLESSTSLDVLCICGNEIDDTVAMKFASSLSKNCTLRRLDLFGNHAITNKAWDAFSALVCNTSNVNMTYFSNHQLASLGGRPRQLGIIIDMNRGSGKKLIATRKVLKHHRPLNMQPFFEWEFKVLPLVINWWKRAAKCGTVYGISEDIIRSDKLWSIYQFIRGMPLVYIESRLRQQLSETRSRKMKLQREQMMLSMKLEDVSQEEEMIMKKLAG